MNEIQMIIDKDLKTKARSGNTCCVWFVTVNLICLYRDFPGNYNLKKRKESDAKLAIKELDAKLAIQELYAKLAIKNRMRS